MFITHSWIILLTRKHNTRELIAICFLINNSWKCPGSRKSALIYFHFYHLKLVSHHTSVLTCQCCIFEARRVVTKYSPMIVFVHPWILRELEQQAVDLCLTCNHSSSGTCRILLNKLLLVCKRSWEIQNTQKVVNFFTIC